jgi:Pvc16 N-terminal domain
MLRTALEFLSGELKGYIEKKEPAMFKNEIAVVPSSLMKTDGTFAVANTQDGKSFKIIMTLVNLEEDRIADSQSYFQKQNDKIQFFNTPVNLNAYILFSVLGDNYLSDLRLLSLIISFFQTNPVFDEERFPNMNSKVEPDMGWQQVGKLITNLHSLTMEQQNNMWAAIGAKYMPNVVYKIRTISFTDNEPKMEAPPVTDIRILDN